MTDTANMTAYIRRENNSINYMYYKLDLPTILLSESQAILYVQISENKYIHVVRVK